METTTDWSLSCHLCKSSFLTSQTAITSDGFVVCPQCRQWSGHELKERKLKSSRCGAYVEDQDRFVDEIWAWITINPKTTLEGFFGVLVGDVPHRAIADSFENALKYLSFVKRAKEVSGHQFQLVRFTKSKVLAGL